MTINVNVTMELSAADITAISEADRRSELDHEIRRQIRGQIHNAFEEGRLENQRNFEADCERMQAEYERSCAEMRAKYEREVRAMTCEYEQWRKDHGFC